MKLVDDDDDDDDELQPVTVDEVTAAVRALVDTEAAHSMFCRQHS